MRMVTRCPACGTAFRVHQQHLDARQGQVRCGHCAVVFNAHMHLAVEADPPKKAEAPTAAAAESGVVAEPARPPKPAREAKVEQEPKTELEPKVERAKEPPLKVPERIKPPAPTVKRTEPVALTMADATQFDFGPSAKATAREAGAKNRGWTVAATMLIVLLFLQGVFLFRTELARAMPPARPLLESACATLGCTVPYPQEAEQITIESSDLQAAPGAKDVLVLSAVLRNRATFAQDFPAIELTLTDEANTTVARRILRSRDYLGGARAKPMFAANAEVPLQLHLDAAGLGASGYRLYVFYP